LYFTPRLHFRYALTELSTLRFSAGRGQRTPNYIAENYNVLASNRQLNFNRPVAPEIAWNTGVSLDQIISVGEKQIRLTADAFYTYFENKQVTDLDFSALEAYFLNTRGSESLSIMAQADYTWFKGFETRLAYKYLRAFDQYLNSKNWSYQIPRHRAFANVAYATESEWKFDATLNWFGQKRLPNTSTSAEAFQQREFSPSFFTLNTQVNKSFKKIEAFIGINNLLNFRQNTPIVNAENPFAPYFDSNFTWGPIFGRMVYAGLNFKLDQKD
jgi:outer membrane receptor for ferrienterochelin and colicin